MRNAARDSSPGGTTVPPVSTKPSGEEKRNTVSRTKLGSWELNGNPMLQDWPGCQIAELIGFNSDKELALGLAAKNWLAPGPSAATTSGPEAPKRAQPAGL